MSKKPKRRPANLAERQKLPGAKRTDQLPAWRSRIGLIIAFFVLTIGLSYVYLAFMIPSSVPEYDYKVVKEYWHDPDAYTEGLLYLNGAVYESTGRAGHSTLRKMDLKTDKPIIHKLDDKLFGEGLTVWNKQLIQLTYRNEIAIAYDLDLNPTGKTWNYVEEGWGLTSDGRTLIMSNGSSILFFRDPESFEIVRKLHVYDGGHPVTGLNELEYVDGKIYANVWHQDYIVEIDPNSGAVISRIFLNGLMPYNQRQDEESVLNGIAFNNDTGHFIVTGKNWPKMFEIELVPRPKSGVK